MSLLKIAVESKRWDLAAHTIVLATVRVINRGVKPDGKTIGPKNGRSKR
jgi:hypothetical protein